MKLYKDITLTAYRVTLIDRRNPDELPSERRHETIVIDGGRLNALHRLGMGVGTYIADHCGRHGYGVAHMRKLGTIQAPVDLSRLWDDNYTAEGPEAPTDDLDARLQSLIQEQERLEGVVNDD